MIPRDHCVVGRKNAELTKFLEAGATEFGLPNTFGTSPGQAFECGGNAMFYPTPYCLRCSGPWRLDSWVPQDDGRPRCRRPPDRRTPIQIEGEEDIEKSNTMDFVSKGDRTVAKSPTEAAVGSFNVYAGDTTCAAEHPVAAIIEVHLSGTNDRVAYQVMMDNGATTFWFVGTMEICKFPKCLVKT